MTSRERVRCALEHTEADKVPVDFGAMRSTGINAMAYGELRQHLGLEKKPVKVYDVFQQLGEPHDDVLSLFQADVVQLHRMYTAFGISNEFWKEGKLDNGMEALYPYEYAPVVNAAGEREIRDASGTLIAKMPCGGLYFDLVNHPYADAETAADLEAVPCETFSVHELDYLQKNAKALYENTDYAILGAFGGNIFEAGQGDFGYETYFMNLSLEKELMHRYNERICEAHLQNLKKYLSAVGEYIDVIQFGDDLGMQNSTQISVSMYREMIKPYHKTLFQYVKKHYPRVKVFLHSCGSIRPLIGDLIDAGVEILNPIQISAADMDPKDLKREFGKDLVFWGGGVSTQTTINTGTLDEIQRSVRENMEIFAPGGGYVFTQIHNFQAGTAPEKVVAVYTEANRVRDYQKSC